MAMSTWPKDIVPVVHYSESRCIEQEDDKIRPQAHSDYVYDYIDTYGHDVDVMIEAKHKELAVNRYMKLHLTDHYPTREHPFGDHCSVVRKLKKMGSAGKVVERRTRAPTRVPTRFFRPNPAVTRPNQGQTRAGSGQTRDPGWGRMFWVSGAPPSHVMSTALPGSRPSEALYVNNRAKPFRTTFKHRFTCSLACWSPLRSRASGPLPRLHSSRCGSRVRSAHRDYSSPLKMHLHAVFGGTFINGHDQ